MKNLTALKKAGLLLGFFLLFHFSFAQQSARKKLILHCDDLGVAHSVNQAAIDMFEAELISSAAIMVPTPWFREIARYASEHPELDIGLHLTLTSEWPNYKWGPVAGREKVPSLVDSFGNLYATSEEAVANIKPEEAEVEIRAQIEMALANGIHPSHLDSHMGVLFNSPDLFQIYIKLGKEYGIPVFIPKEQLLAGYPQMADFLDTGALKIERLWSAYPGISPDNWTQAYIDYLNTMPVGVTEIIIHLGYDTYELEHSMGKDIGWGSAWRQRDLEAIRDPAFIKALKDNGIVLITYRELYSEN